MLGVVCGALNVADAAFRTCMTDFLHSLERCGAGAAQRALSRAMGTGIACPKALLQAWRPEFFSPWATFLPPFAAKALQIRRQCPRHCDSRQTGLCAVTHSSGSSAIALSGEGKKFHTAGKTAFKGKWLG